MESEEDIFHLMTHFTGHVQGVGFRYSVKQIARGFEVTGYVKNLADGRVELDIEGVEGECRRFLREVENELDNFIRDTEQSEGHRGRLYTRFRIA